MEAGEVSIVARQCNMKSMEKEREKEKWARRKKEHFDWKTKFWEVYY